MDRLPKRARIGKYKKQNPGGKEVAPKKSSPASLLSPDLAKKEVQRSASKPVGRPKGRKNTSTIMREKFELLMREYIAKGEQYDKAIAAIDRMFDIMVNGEEKVAVVAFKNVFDKLITTPKAPQEEAVKHSTRVEIIISEQNESNLPVIDIEEYNVIEQPEDEESA